MHTYKHRHTHAHTHKHTEKISSFRELADVQDRLERGIPYTFLLLPLKRIIERQTTHIHRSVSVNFKQASMSINECNVFTLSCRRLFCPTVNELQSVKKNCYNASSTATTFSFDVIGPTIK